MQIPSIHIIGGKKLGGAERFYVRLVNALAKHGEHVAAATVQGGEIDAAVASNIPRHPLPLAGIWDLWSRYRIGRITKKEQPAIIQSYMGRATRLTHLPRGKLPVHIARLGGYYNLKGYHHAHAWVGNTRGICDYLVREGMPADKVFYIGNFVDPASVQSQQSLTAFRAQWGIPEDALVVLGLGRLHANKGFTDLLTAFSKLPTEVNSRPLYLLMVGDGPLRESLHQEAEQLGIAQRVVWAGWQYDPAPCYQTADVFVCSSRHEPLGNVILEAWANGVPVVSSAAQGPVELITPGDNGLLTPVADADGLAHAIRQGLALDGDERQRLITNGRAKLNAQFSEQAIVRSYLELYEKLTAGL